MNCSLLFTDKRKEKTLFSLFRVQFFVDFMRRLKTSGLVTVVLVFFKIFSTLEYRVNL